MDDFLGGPGRKSPTAAGAGRGTGAAAATRPAGEKAVAGNVKPNGEAATKHPNYADDAAGWKSRQAATGNAVRENSGNRYAAAYSSGAYRTGAVGGYPYAAGAGATAAAATYAGLGSFLGAGWTGAAAKPAYYGYGSGGNVYYENNSVYVEGRKVGTAAEYCRQANEMVAAAPAADQVSAEADDWMSLGVFAFTREDGDDAQAMIELAVNKQGVIAGTFYNEATGLSRSLKGTADPKTQRVAVGFADGKNADIVLETGMYNLTQDEAPGLLHRGEDESQPVLLVRLPNADEASGK